MAQYVKHEYTSLDPQNLRKHPYMMVCMFVIPALRRKSMEDPQDSAAIPSSQTGKLQVQ